MKNILLVVLAGLGLVAAADMKKEIRSADNEHQLAERGTAWNTPDHPDWMYLNGRPWWKLYDGTQQDHARYHAYLSMAAYGDFRGLCPKTFTKTGPNGFEVLQEFNVNGYPKGQSGFIARVQEMEKIVIVFKGNGLDGLDRTPVSISDLVSNCQNCKVMKGVRQLYMLAKQATNDFAVAKAAVAKTGLKFSVTGHGVGGAVAALAALDLGARNLVHYAHNQGTPRAFNYASVVRYDNLFQVVAGQSLVSWNDPVVHAVPLSYDTYHLGQKAHIFGDKTQWWVNCFGNNENSTCLGTGKGPASDHTYYFTPIGQCGSANKGF